MDKRLEDYLTWIHGETRLTLRHRSIVAVNNGKPVAADKRPSWVPREPQTKQRLRIVWIDGPESRSIWQSLRQDGRLHGEIPLREIR